MTGQELIDALHRGRKIKPKDHFGSINSSNPKATCALGAIALGLGLHLDDDYSQAKALDIPVSQIYKRYDDWEWKESGGVDTGFETPDDAVIAYLETL